MMKKQIAKAAATAAAVLGLLSALAGCAPGVAPPAESGSRTAAVTEAAPKKLEITDEFRISCARGDGIALSLAGRLQTELKDSLGASVKLNTSFTEIPEKEIVVGKLSRADAEAVYGGLGGDGWTVKAEGNRIYIAGVSNKGLCTAYDAFVAALHGGKITEGMTMNGKCPLITGFDFEKGDYTDTKVSSAYPRIYRLRDGTMLLGYDGMRLKTSDDEGASWSRREVQASGDRKGVANAAFFEDDDGVIYYAYRSVYSLTEGGKYYGLHVSTSHDKGKTWEYHSAIIEHVDPLGEKGVWEPHLGILNGKLTCFYANEIPSATHYQNIEYKQWDEEKKEWNNQTVVSDGDKHKSRDGMPVWQRLSTGEYVCVMEAFDKTNNNKFCVKLTYSADGINWSEPITVMSPLIKETRCAAPYIVELPNGQLVVSCQTDEKLGEPTKGTHMAISVSDGTPVRYLTEKNFSEHGYPFGADDSTDCFSTWNGMYVTDNYIFFCTSGSKGHGVRVMRIKLETSEN